MNMDERMKLPDGFRFNPFEKELINSYLKPKVLGEKLPCNVVEERQLYGPNANPWQVFDPKNHPWIEHEVSCGKFEKLAYVFVDLTKKAAPNSVKNKNNGGREQFIKKAGCGCWDGQTSRTEIRDSNGDLIGEKRLLVFEVNDVSNQEDCTGVGYWRMHEYSLCGVNTNIPNTTNTVLCKITLDSSKNPPIKLRPNKKINQGKPQPQKNKKKNTKSVLVNVSSPSTLNCAVVDAHVEGISQNCGPKGEETDVDVEWINSIYDQEDGLGIGSSLLGQVDTGPVSFDRPKGEDLFYESDVKTCDDVEWMNSIYDQEDGLGIVSSLLEEVDTGPVSFDYCWPAKHDNGYQISAREEAQGYEFDITSYLEPTYEQLLEDFTTNLGKRKLQAGCSPFLGIEKGQEARVFNDPQLDPRRCSQVILKHTYLLNQGQSFTKAVSSVKWLEDELELNALHNPRSRRGSGNDKAAVTQRTALSAALGGRVEVSAMSTISGVKATYLLAVAFLEIIRFSSNGGILNCGPSSTASRSAFSCVFEYLKSPNLMPAVFQCLTAIVHRAFSTALSWLEDRVSEMGNAAEIRESALCVHACSSYISPQGHI